MIDLIPSKETVIIQDVQEEKVGDIVIPMLEKDRDKPEVGVVIAVGPGDQPFGKGVKLEPGDLIYYERYIDNRITYAAETYNFIKFNKILCVKKSKAA